MLVLLMILLQQAPTLTQTATQDLPERQRLALKSSATGKYLVIGQADRIDIRDAETLAPVKELPLRWTTFGFDERDAELVVVGEQVVRFRTKDWTELSRHALKGAEFVDLKPSRRFDFSEDQLKEAKAPLLPGQAFLTSDLEIYYRTKMGGLSLAAYREGEWVFKALELHIDDFEEQFEAQLERILGWAESGLFVTSENGNVGVSFRGRNAFRLSGISKPIAASVVANLAVCVASESEGIYSTSTWKNLVHRESQKNLAAAVDRRNGWVFVSDANGLTG
jgi:hypothetical protein